MSFRALTAVVILGGVLGTAFIPLADDALAQFKGGFEKVDAVGADSGIKKFANLSEFILAVLKVVGAVVAVLALAALIYGAVMYITSLGDEGKTEKAKHVIMYAIIGLLVLGAAGIVVNVVINLIRGA